MYDHVFVEIKSTPRDMYTMNVLHTILRGMKIIRANCRGNFQENVTIRASVILGTVTLQ